MIIDPQWKDFDRREDFCLFLAVTTSRRRVDRKIPRPNRLPAGQAAAG
jgi:hypothetical protein